MKRTMQQPKAHKLIFFIAQYHVVEFADLRVLCALTEEMHSKLGVPHYSVTGSALMFYLRAQVALSETMLVG